MSCIAGDVVSTTPYPPDSDLRGNPMKDSPISAKVEDVFLTIIIVYSLTFFF